MKPVLFDEDSTSFSSNGLGRLDPISCEVTEERNGVFELEMEIAQTSLHADQIGMNSIILAKPNQTADLQAFRVYNITKPINGRFTVTANHISYQLSYIPAMPFTIAADTTACKSALLALKSNAAESCPFTFDTDVQTVASFTVKVPASIRSKLGGSDGSILDQFGGEFEFNNYSVYLHKNRGLTIPKVSLRYGKNITDLTQEEYITNTVTGVVPFWTDTDGINVVTLPEKSVDSQYAANYPFKRTVPLDCSQAFENAPSQSDLRTYAQAYVNQSGIGVPTVSIKVSFVNISDYEGFESLQTVSLCDNVNVYFEKLDIKTTSKVVKTVFNVLTERYESIEIGTIKPSLAQTITDTNGAITTALEKANYNVRNATAWLTGSNGYVMAVKNSDGTWKELLFLDTNDAATAHNVLRINENGIGFSSTGVAGPYTQAWTLDGKLVVGGTSVPSFTVYDANDNIIFQTSRAGTIWNSTNSSMNASGTLSATGAQLTNAAITGGNLYQENSGRHINIVNGNIHGGFSNETENVVYLAYRVSGNSCVTLEGQGGVCFTSPRIYVRDGTGGSVYEGYNGSVITAVNTSDVSIVDYYGETKSFKVVTGIERRDVLHGIVHT
ncbi:MAG: phage tail protein [Clostridiales bacterium]|nr:phage tail protein [Clostridiales bacterium]MBQ1573034.1 phage tail protein [Clostridiales bacterium]